jgi:hypothetical protein
MGPRRKTAADETFESVTLYQAARAKVAERLPEMVFREAGVSKPGDTPDKYDTIKVLETAPEPVLDDEAN